jgi:L-ascorbate 6-phosphate lactonase
MNDLAQVLRSRTVSRDHLAVYWLCQAGFAFKNSSGQVVAIDPYLSDVVERVVGFKRMMTCPIVTDDLEADLIICTHEHLDHMDTDALAGLAKNGRTHFAGPIECMKEFQKQQIPGERCHLLEEGKSCSFGDITVHAVYADHGELAPDALGVVVDFDGVRVYHTGDTAYRPEEFKPAIAMKPHILLPCINGAFGNLNAEEATMLTELVAPQIVIPTHFWMFVEQNGDPRGFLERCSTLAPSTRALLLKPGEEFVFRKPE